MVFKYMLICAAIGVAVYGSASNFDVDEIEKNTQMYSDMYLDRDFCGTYDKVFHPRAYIMPPGLKSAQGKADMIKAYDQITKGVKRVDFSTVDTKIYEQIAVQVLNRTTVYVNDTINEGKALFVWKKVWQLRYSAWNSNS